MNLWHDFSGPNAAYLLDLYERYRRDPAAVDAITRSIFETWTPTLDTAGAALETAPAAFDQIMGTIHLAQAIRSLGHRRASIDPLGSLPLDDISLDAAYHGVTDDDLRQLPASLVGGPLAEKAANAWEAMQALRRIYCSTIGYDYGHILAPEERDWLRAAAESERFSPATNPIDPLALLDQLTRVETFEHFLHRTFPGKTRFSIEGLDMLVPMITELIGAAAEAGSHTILIGMAHRGRLNVMAHLLNKPYAQILAEFKDPAEGRTFFIREDLGWTGDVKYHAGAQRAMNNGAPLDLVVYMPPNPSHLELINPIVEGMARAAGTILDRAGAPQFDPSVSLPILIHGDASFPAQGVVAETLNLSLLVGYRTGGTLHIIANNQLGFTADAAAGRSTLYASDLARGFGIPIVHVNADDPEACLNAARLAHAYRTRFGKDFLIDLVGYRRHGHNEGDEPSFTQPLMYQAIEQHPSVRELWARTLITRGLTADQRPDDLVRQQLTDLQHTLENLKVEAELREPPPELPTRGAARHVTTAVPVDRLRDLNDALLNWSEGFALNPKLERVMQRRRAASDPAQADQPIVDWASAESLALASILADGIAIRFTGQDVERGTFSQRHVVLHDARTGETHTPLQALPQATAAFAVFNSPLSENAALGFEVGYNLQAPDRLTIWEAQYGDFINNAQTVIDEYLVSARAKWGQTPSLVLLLPHAFEGQGPDHSSGRPERFLQMAAETGLRVANCTTAAQYFHLLRRQALLLKTDPLPLIVLTPKGLLRHPLTASSLRDLAESHWQPVIDDAGIREPDRVRRLIWCSGKVHIDLISNPQRADRTDIAIARVEQLYAFPENEMRAVLERYANLEEVIWLQEEPENMGAWTYIQPHLQAVIAGRWPLRYLGRPRSSSPAEGSSAWHALNQSALIGRAYALDYQPVP